MQYDLIFVGGDVIDGSGSDRYRADVAILNDKIAAIGDLADAISKRSIDISGKIICPGFIDVHTHDDSACLQGQAMWPKLSQGVTTVITGNCGLSLAPLVAEQLPPEPLNLLGDENDYIYNSFAAYFKAVEDSRPAVNVAALVGHNTLRVAAMDDLEFAACEEEVVAMQALLQEGLDAGALGMSSGVYYGPGRAADISEVTALVKVVASAGGIYTSHIRDEYSGIIDAIDEAACCAGASNTPLQISHHKCAGPKNWGRSSETLSHIEALCEQQDVALDCYPYSAGASVLNTELVDGKIDILVNASTPHPEMDGLYLGDISKSWNCTQIEAAGRLMPAVVCYFQMHEDDVRRILSHKLTMIGSDGLPGEKSPHPRLWGAFPRVLGHYSRDENLFSLESAVHKMTGMSASRFSLQQRGSIEQDAFADIVVFSPELVADRATYEEPCQPAAGIDWVLVNGVVALESGSDRNAGAGRVIRRRMSTRKAAMSSPQQEMENNMPEVSYAT